jgi:hypothetical protein
MMPTDKETLDQQQVDPANQLLANLIDPYGY